MASIHIYKIDAFEILRFQPAWRAAGVPGWRLSSNGSYFSGGNPAGPYRVKNGNLSVGIEKYAFRRATLASTGNGGRVRLMKDPGHDFSAGAAQDLAATFGSTPRQFMGGGFMLVDAGTLLTKAQIESGQGKPGSPAYQVEAARGWIGFANDAADALFLLVSVFGGPAPLAAAASLKRRFPHIGLFDGGGPFWFRDRQNECPAQDGRGETPWFAVGMNGTFDSKV